MPTTGTGGPTGRRATTALRAAGAGVYGAGAGPLLRRRIPVCGVLQWHLPLLRYTSRYLAAEDLYDDWPDLFLCWTDHLHRVLRLLLQGMYL